MALAAINVARSEFGFDVGRELSIVGFDDTELASWPLFGLTTYSQPVAAMVERVVAIIRDSLARRELPPVQDVVPGQLIVRDSARLPATGIALVDGHRIWTPA
jgi:DNA-binding LacI/PurR family transcriptional regulator